MKKLLKTQLRVVVGTTTTTTMSPTMGATMTALPVYMMLLYCSLDHDEVPAGTLYAADIMLLVHGALVTYSTRSSLSMMYN